MTPLPGHHHGTESHTGHRPVAGGLARAAVFGVSDGLVSNVSLIIGFASSGVDSSLVRLAGLAGAIAGAVSMAAGEYVSIAAQNELVEREVAIERRELSRNAAAETAELAATYESHGMSRDLASAAAHEVMQQPESALVVHAREELGIDPTELASPWRTAGISFICFLIGALLPVIPWLIGSGTAAAVTSVVIGVVAAAIVGALIGNFAETGVLRSAIRQVVILLIACSATFVVGTILGVNVS